MRKITDPSAELTCVGEVSFIFTSAQSKLNVMVRNREFETQICLILIDHNGEVERIKRLTKQIIAASVSNIPIERDRDE
ncbi:MAG: hypothetical protein AAF720_06700 [Pseudomonadota bacterium]